MVDRQREGLVEYWSGWFLRGIMGFLFLLGLWGIVASLVAGTADRQLHWMPVLTAPYLLIRYRDPDVAVIPYLS